jgi:hypothetical protein
MRHMVRILRVAGLWLVGVAVLAGPLGVNASVASPITKNCGDTCPCDDAATDLAAPAAHDSEAGTEDCNDDCGSEHHDEAPCNDECPEDCPECSCCTGLGIGLVPLMLPVPASFGFPTKALAPSDSPARSDVFGVFRPPRSLT